MKTDIGKFIGYMEHDLADRLVELKMGTLPALFFVHPAGGSTSSYKELAPKLDSDQAVYGIEAGTGLVSHSIESLAGKYLEAVRRQQPEGPYFLGGWSFGGIVALEMTRQLEECGEEVELLTLIDIIPPTHYAVRETLSYLSKDNVALLELIGRNFQAMSSRIIPISYADISAQPADRRENWFVRQLLQEKGFTQPITENFIIPFIRSFQQCTQLLLDYEPTPCQAHILFFRARDASKPIQQMLANGDAEVISPETGIEWSKLTRGNLRAYVVPGTHETMMFEPFVEKIAKEISRTIQVRPIQG